MRKELKTTLETNSKFKHTKRNGMKEQKKTEKHIFKNIEITTRKKQANIIRCIGKNKDKLKGYHKKYRALKRAGLILKLTSTNKFLTKVIKGKFSFLYSNVSN